MASITRKRVTDASEEYDVEETPGGVAALSDSSDVDQPHERTSKEQSTGRTSPTVRSGWGAPKQEQRDTVKAPYLKLSEKKGNEWVPNGKHIVKLLTDEPSLNYFEHYVNSTGKRYICPGQPCSLCKAGHRAGYRFMMNIVDMEMPETVITWTFGNEVSQQLQAFAEDDITYPLNRENLYFQVYHIKVEGRQAPGTKVLPLKARDLQEDYGVEPLTGDELAELSESLYGDEILFFWSARKIEEAAMDLTAKDLPKNR